ncbi:SRPBCC family protein [Streptomyces sp. NPDC060022]|uniref:SRPBCC family protein n=1 Tax=Streptomyces sp. NPDC060022 TaxID=3347039 RepID=UPI003679809E
MDINFYRFDLSWEIEHPAGTVYSALAALQAYPRWWPEYRAVRRIDEDTVAITVQSSLPYKLRLTNRELIQDAKQGHLRLAIGGDLAGWIDFALTAQDSARTLVHITQECTAEKKLLRVLAPVARRAMIRNHGLMMRSGQAGLNRFLSAELS